MKRRTFLKGLALVAGGIAVAGTQAIPCEPPPEDKVNPAYLNATYELSFVPLSEDYIYAIDPWPIRYELVNGNFVRVYP